MLNKLKEEHFDIFLEMISKYLDDVHSGAMHKGRFIGMYMDEVKKLDIEDYEAIQLKYPQFVSNDKNDRSNNWLDFILGMDEETFKEFKRGLTS